MAIRSKAPKIAKFHHLRYFELTCPDCGEFIQGPTGSHMIEVGSVAAGELLRCYACPVDVKVPKRAGGALAKG